MTSFLEDYETWTETTVIYDEGITKLLLETPLQEQFFVVELTYLAEGLAGEAGEVANFSKKVIRDGFDEELFNTILSELGDVLWYSARIAKLFNVSLEDIMTQNRLKLTSRKQRGKIGGTGDGR